MRRHHPGTLSCSQLSMLALLASRQHVTKEQILHHLYSGRPECEWPLTCVKVVDVHICHLRKKLKPLGIEIRNLRGCGHDPALYSIAPEQRERARFIADNYWSVLSGDVELEVPAHV